MRNGSEMILTLLMTLLGAYAVVLGLLYLGQSGLLYMPGQPSRAVQTDPASMGLPFENLYLETADGERLHAWYVNSAQSRGSVLFLHGNAGNISHRLESIAIFVRLGLDVLIVDYRGYGQSTGSPSEQGTYQDATAAWTWLRERRAVAARNIILFGRSLGSAVAVELATRVPAAGLILESGFTSVADLGAQLYPFLPVRLLTRFHYDSLSRIERVDMPVLVVHSRSDEIIPYSHGRRLFERAGADKAFLELRGGHNDGFLLTGRAYVAALEQFIAHALATTSTSGPAVPAAPAPAGR